MPYREGDRRRYKINGRCPYFIVKKPSVQTVAKIARALDISMEELIE